MKGPRQDTKLPVFRCNGVTVHTVIVLCSKSIGTKPRLNNHD